MLTFLGILTFISRIIKFILSCVEHEKAFITSDLLTSLLSTQGKHSPGSEIIKLFSCSTQLSMKFKLLSQLFILLINVKMPEQDKFHVRLS